MALDADWMARALALAARGVGRTRPNPPVGAVVVSADGKRLLGAGWHRRAGTPHAEVHALRAAGAAARGATLYVTLEPCCTTGRTPPCTDAILAAGIARVVAAVRDPNPRHAGRGLRRLRREGVRVEQGVCAEEASRLIEPFATWIAEQRPMVTLKIGATLDGRIGDRQGRSRWITCPTSRAQVQRLRRSADAILVGGRTARLDDPSLGGGAAGGSQGPLRVVLDERGGLPAGLKVLTDAAASRTIVATTRLCPQERVRAYARHGARVWTLPAVGGRVSLPALLLRLGADGILHVLCEGGGELAAELLRKGLAGRIVWFVAPSLLGGTGVAALGGPGWALAQSPGLTFTAVERCGRDVMLEARPGRGRR
jgi:diaminohydroxyphosphoribosylaminopyrimidine deaminase/5-amino-6-(5-phosphoribosylamino)uracil reductase